MAGVLFSVGAWGFQEPNLLDAPPSPLGAGGGGKHFTGSPLGRGYSCALCHQGDVGSVQLQVTTTPAELQYGAYTPGAIYQIEIKLIGEHHGLDHPTTNCGNLGSGPTCNWNGLAAEFVDVSGNTAGTLCPNPPGDGTCDASGRALLSGDQTQVYGNPSLFGGDTDWTFTWQAPSESVPVILYAAAVDGDGGGPAQNGTAPRDGTAPDIDGDAVATVVLSAAQPGNTLIAKSCGAPGLAPLGILAWLGIGALKRRRR